MLLLCLSIICYKHSMEILWYNRPLHLSYIEARDPQSFSDMLSCLNVEYCSIHVWILHSTVELKRGCVTPASFLEMCNLIQIKGENNCSIYCSILKVAERQQKKEQQAPGVQKCEPRTFSQLARQLWQEVSIQTWWSQCNGKHAHPPPTQHTHTFCFSLQRILT